MLELQPARWALRLLPEDAAQSMSIVCVVRARRRLAGSPGRRAAWLASWAGRWALGAAGSVEVDEKPTDTIERELQEEWSVAPERLRIEALVMRPSGLVLLVGQAWLADGAEVDARPRARRVRMVARRRRALAGGGREPLRRMASLLVSRERGHVPPPRGGVVHALGRLLALLICAFALGNPEPETFVLGLCPRPDVDRDVADLHRGRARPDDPVLARGHGRGAGRPGPFAGSIGFVVRGAAAGPKRDRSATRD